ncbi:MAG: YiiX/YebB-like N1pC/P60 family cysteine hydrolase [Halobacteriota archaeon]
MEKRVMGSALAVLMLLSAVGVVTVSAQIEPASVTIPSDSDVGVTYAAPPGQPLTASFKYAGVHDSTTSNFELYGASTGAVDAHPLLGGKILLDASASEPQANIKNYNWQVTSKDADFSYSMSRTTSTPGVDDFSFPRAVKYEITLTVDDGNGHSSASVSKELDLSLTPGDLVFDRTPYWSTLGSLLNQQHYMHVGIYVGVINGQDVMVESTEVAAHGSQQRGVHQSLLTGWGAPGVPFATAYHVNTGDGLINQAAAQWALLRTQERLPYDFKNVFFDKSSTGGTERGFYCSELVWAAYWEASGHTINLGDTSTQSTVAKAKLNDGDPVWPDAIARDASALTFQSGHWERYPL